MSNFGDYFKQNMDSLGVPTPGTLATNLGAAMASSKVIADAIAKYGSRVTVADLIAAGLISEIAEVAIAVGAAAYLGAVTGSIIVAATKCAVDNISIDDLITPDDGPWIDPSVNSKYRTAVTYRPHDPLAIDLDGDGIETVGITANPILFDHNGDGIRTGTGWLKGDDAWLVRDLNGNGQIDSGAELFGVDTVINGTLGPRTASSGFEALVALDTGDGSATTTAAGYKDNVFDAKDAAFSQVRLWQDLNQNGISEANELSTLADKGIVSISLAATSDTTNLGNGNTITGKASVTRTTGTTTIDSVAVTAESAGNLGLATNGFYRSFPDTIPLTDAAKVLPEMRGSGFVRDLREAASLSPELAGIVAQFAQATTRADQIALIDNLLESWAKSSGKYDAPDVLEALDKTVVGESSTQLFLHITTLDPAEAEIVKNGHGLWSAVSFSFQNSSPYLTTEYSSITGTTIDVVNAAGMEILRQKSVLEVFNGARFVDLNQTTTKPNSTGMAGGGGGGGGGGGVMPTEGPLVEFGMVISNVQAGLINQAYETLRESVYSGLLLQTRLAPYLDAVQLVIDAQSIHFDATALDTKFNQAFAANPQEAMLDLLDLNLYAQDTLQAVGFNGVQKLKGWLDGLATDSPIWSTLNAAGLLPTGTTTGTVYRDLGFGQDTAETLRMGSGNDLAFAQGGNDFVFGEDGDDTLDGGAGNDYLSGGNGADTYLFGRGSGQDTIGNSDNDAASTAPDTIQLQYDVAPSDVKLTRLGSDLVITINGTTDSLRVNSYFNADGDTPYAVDNIRFSDFTVWDVDAVKAIVQMGTTGNDTIYGYAVGDTISAGNGNDTVYGYAGADLIDGGKGKDSIEGGEGADTLIGGAGNDALYGGNGADTYVFGRGAGQDTIYNFDNDALNVNADYIQVDTGIAPSDVTLTRYTDDLYVRINGTDDILCVSGYFSADATAPNAVEQIVFSDSTVWDITTVKAKVQAGTEGNDTLYGYAVGDTISAGNGNDTVYGYNGSDQLDGGSGRDNLQGGDGDDTLYGGAGNDTLDGGNGEDSLQGNEGNDYLYGYASNDRLDGGAGNDFLSGGLGADTYLFGKGSGQDTVGNSDTDAVGVNADTILLGTGITTTDVTLTRVSDDLLISINGTDDSLRVSSYFSAEGTTSNVVENIQFANSTVWDVATVKTKVQASTTGNDTLYGYALNDTLSAGDGNDTVYGNNGNDQLSGDGGRDNLQGGEGDDTLYGGVGSDLLYGGNGQDSLLGDENDDTLYGEDGNDTLDGGVGNDFLRGGNGADTYVFGKGSGQDTVSNGDNDAIGINTDTILLGDGITATDVTLTRVSDDLIISLNGSDDSLRVSDYFKADEATSNLVENIKFANSTVWDYAAVKSRLSTTTTPQGVTLNGTSNSETLTGSSGNDILHGYGGDDTLDGGSGNDYLGGEAGNDTFVFGLGYGKDTINAYDTTAGKLDVVSLGSGIGVADVSVGRSGTDLLLKLNGRSDSLTISSYFNNDAAGGFQVEQIKFADTTAWDVNTIKAKVLAATSDNDILTGYSSGDTIVGLAGDDTIHGMAGGDSLDGGAGEDSISGDAGADTIYGGAQNDKLSGDAGADSLFGDAGDDVLYGGSENDTLDGGAGNDFLSGDAGNDTYIFGLGYGKDTISSNDTTVGKCDVVSLGAGISAADVTVSSSASGTDLLLTINGTSDSLTISGYFNKDAASGSQVEQIKFADTTIWDVNTIKAMAPKGTANGDTLTGYSSSDTISGLGGDDSIHGMDGGDSLYGGEGDDKLYGDAGADTIYGGSQNDLISGDAGADSLFGDAGDDILYGGTDNDTLDGGAGNDTLNGDAGNDTYVFAAGSGKDTIAIDNDTSSNKLNTLNLSSGISAGGLSFDRSGDDLVIARSGSSDSISINQFFWNNDPANTRNPIQQVQILEEGVTWSSSTVQHLANALLANDTTTGTAAADKIYGLDNADTITGLDGSDFLFGNGGADSLSGGTDADWLFGGNGADTLDGGTGADTMVGGRNDDYYIVDSADDVIIEHAYADDFNSYDQIESSVSYIVPDNVEAITLTGSTDINATANNNGCDMNGNAGNNYLKGGDGLDFIFGDEGVDTLEGGAGDDYYYLTGDEDTIIEQAGGGLDQIWAFGDGIHMADNVERLYMQSFLARTAYGNNGNNLMAGNSRANTLYGGGGNDRLFGYAGDDAIYGGQGNDSLYGSVGNDVYHFQRGDGQDLISDYDTTAGAKDSLVFDGAVDSSQVWLTRSGNDLVVSIIGTTDKVTIGGWYLNDYYQVESITAAGNGKTLDSTKVDALVNAMAGFTPPPAGQTTLPQSYQDQLASVMAASWS